MSISIFDKYCYAFQPLYKQSKKMINVWKNKVAEFAKEENIKVYVENALNEVADKVTICGNVI